MIAISLLVFYSSKSRPGFRLRPFTGSGQGATAEPSKSIGRTPLEARDPRLPWVSCSLEASSLAAAVPGLVRIDPHGPGITLGPGHRWRSRYLDPAGAEITDATTLGRIRALRYPARLGGRLDLGGTRLAISRPRHRQQGPAQHLYPPALAGAARRHKFGHMLRFAEALPRLRTATTADLKGHRGLTRDRVAAVSADRPRHVPYRRRKVRRTGPPLRRYHAAEAARARHP